MQVRRCFHCAAGGFASSNFVVAFVPHSLALQHLGAVRDQISVHLAAHVLSEVVAVSQSFTSWRTIEASIAVHLFGASGMSVQAVNVEKRGGRVRGEKGTEEGSRL
jgi:uncharacterized protein CbrC (UPF0167 family)